MKLYMFWMLVLSGLFFVIKRDHSLQGGHNQMCEKLQSEFVEKMNAVDLAQCKHLYTKSLSFKSWEENTNKWLSTWGWSHLSVYSPQETDEIWSSKSKSIGVRIKDYSGQYLVQRAHNDSEFKKGDLFLSVNEKNKPSYDDIMYSGGSYLIKRQGVEVEVKATVLEYTWNDTVELKGRVLNVPSFRGEFFEDEKIEALIKKINEQRSQNLYVDFRNNYGGNIVAGLKFLSMFLCEETVIGEFNIPSKKGLGESDYPMTTEQSVQVEHMRKFERVFLRVPKREDCIRKEVSVLVSSSTSSTAELVAQAFIDLKRGRVIGEQTSGRMVLSSWDQIPNFPEGYYFAYPYALYKSISGATIENEGVDPDVYRTYSFDLESMGKDSFLN